MRDEDKDFLHLVLLLLVYVPPPHPPSLIHLPPLASPRNQPLEHQPSRRTKNSNFFTKNKKNSPANNVELICII